MQKLQAMFNFAAEDGPHISFKAEPILELGSFTLTNSMLYGFIISALIMVFGVAAAKRVRVKPVGGIVQFAEMAMEFIISMLEGIFNSKEKAMKYAPIFGTFFIFIFFSNLSGLVPLVGEGLTVGKGTLLRPFTADLNGTLAMSLVAIITVQILSIRESGVKGHLKHYFTDKPFNPINMFIGVLEVFSEGSRVISLSLRLFLNTAIGEALVSIFIFLGGPAASFTLLPIAVFEVLVALIQAYVFTVLTANYLGMAIAHSHDDHEEPDEDHSTDTVTTGNVPASASVNGN